MLETDSIKRNPMFVYLVVLTISSTVGLQTWTTLFNNFAVDVATLGGNHVGMIQSIREIPGFLALLAVFVIRFIPEHRLSAVSILVLGVGLAATGFFPSYAGIALTTLVSSFGFHYYETTNMSLTLQYFKKHESPWVFGRLTSLAAATSIGIGLLIWLMMSYLSFRLVYLIVGGLIASAGIWAFTRDPSDPEALPQRKQMILRKRYWLFYFLTFMAGARRQIFIAFSVLLLVQKFNYSVQEVTLLFVINNSINYFLSPLVGKTPNCWWRSFTFSIRFSSPSPSPSAPIFRRWGTLRTSPRAWPSASPSTTWRPCFCRRSGGCSGWSTTASPSSRARPWASFPCWRCRK
jgi:hypothetical protein